MLSSSERKTKIVAVIPFLNERKFIVDVVQKTLNYVDLIIAVDDGSTDNSANLISNFEKVILITNDNNYGKGYAIRKGFEKAIEIDSEIIFTLDGDNQHNPDMIPEFLDKIKSHDIVIGNRLNNLKTMPFHRRLSNKITSYLLSKKLGVKIKDSQCGFRAYRNNVIKKVQTVFNGFEAESEILVKAIKNNFTIGFVDIPTIYGSQESKMKSFQAIKGFIKVLMI